MELSLDQNQNSYTIRSYQPGELKINEGVYHHSLILSADKLIEWAPQRFEQLTDADLKQLITLQPALLIIGTGAAHHHLSALQQSWFLEARIGLEVMSTSAACRTYNVLMAEGRKAWAALILDEKL